MQQRSIAVVGGGIAGLVAAWRLAQHGHGVTVFEAGVRAGGQVHTATVAGHPVDVGAESMHLAGAHVAALLGELDLTSTLVAARSGPTWIFTGGRLRPLPDGVGPAGPTRLRPVLRAGVLSPTGMARAACEPLVRRGPANGDIAVGELVTRRFGRQVTDRLVDPLLGNLHGGDVGRLSVRATVPDLAAKATAHRSLLLAQLGRRKRGGAPASVTFPGGLQILVDRLVGFRFLDVQLNEPVRSVVPSNSGYRLDGQSGPLGTFDGVVLAVPPLMATQMLGPIAPAASTRLAAVGSASVATVVVTFPRAMAEAVPAMRGTGLLVPSSERRLLKAATFLSTKWAHLDDAENVFVRLSAGRAGSSVIDDLDDAQLADRLRADLSDLTGLTAEPGAVHVQRWPHALAQLEVGHLERIVEVRKSLSTYPGLVLAGAAYDGLGVSSCVRSGAHAAERLRAEHGVGGVRT